MHGVFFFYYLIEIINVLAYCYRGAGSLRNKSTLKCRSILTYAITSNQRINQTIKQAWILDYDFMVCLSDNNVVYVHYSIRQ